MLVLIPGTVIAAILTIIAIKKRKHASAPFILGWIAAFIAGFTGWGSIEYWVDLDATFARNTNGNRAWVFTVKPVVFRRYHAYGLVPIADHRILKQAGEVHDFLRWNERRISKEQLADLHAIVEKAAKIRIPYAKPLQERPTVKANKKFQRIWGITDGGIR